MKKYLRLIIYAMITLCAMGYIFSQSLQSGEKSNQKSQVVAEYIKPMLNDQEISEKDLNAKVRKVAHGVEFAVLGVCVSLLGLEISRKRKQRMVSFPLLLVLATAVTDEFLQSFFGRTDEVTDIVIDFSGAVLGIALIWLIQLLRKKKIGGEVYE